MDLVSEINVYIYNYDYLFNNNNSNSLLKHEADFAYSRMTM